MPTTITMFTAPGWPKVLEAHHRGHTVIFTKMEIPEQFAQPEFSITSSRHYTPEALKGTLEQLAGVSVQYELDADFWKGLHEQAGAAGKIHWKKHDIREKAHDVLALLQQLPDHEYHQDAIIEFVPALHNFLKHFQ